MKKVLFFLLILLFLPAGIYSQHYQINLTVDPSVAELEFGSFIISNNLSGAPRIFAIDIFPSSGQVKLHGEILWKKDSNSDFVRLFQFSTRKFTAGTYYNTDFGTRIKIATSDADGGLLDENRKRGKPTGQYKIVVQLLDVDGNEYQGVKDDEIITFENPAQTLTIRSPRNGATENIGGVLAEWNELDGIEYYSVTANVKDDMSVSDEEAIKKGDPIIDDANVGLNSSVELRSLLDREWLPGQEIVLQVAAHPKGGGPGDVIYSEIIHFYLEDPNQPMDQTHTEEVRQMLQNIQGSLGDDLLDQVINGNVKITDFVWEDSGMPLSPEEIQQLLNYLKQNPDVLINIETE